MRKKQTMYECVIRCEYKKHVNYLYCDIFVSQSRYKRSIVKEEEDGTFSTYTIRDRMAGIKPVVLHFDDPRKLLLSPTLSRLVGSSFKASQPSNYNDMCDDLQRCLDFRASTHCRDMIKHKKLNDANNLFNCMV